MNFYESAACVIAILFFGNLIGKAIRDAKASSNKHKYKPVPLTWIIREHSPTHVYLLGVDEYEGIINHVGPFLSKTDAMRYRNLLIEQYKLWH